MKYRAYGRPMFDESTPINHSKQVGLDAYGKTEAPAPAVQTSQGFNSSVPPRAPDATCILLLNAAQKRQYGSAIEYGQQLIEGKAAEPSDLSIVAEYYMSVGDCADARVWAQKGEDAFRAAGLQPDDALRRVTACCEPGHKNTREPLDPALKARMVRL